LPRYKNTARKEKTVNEEGKRTKEELLDKSALVLQDARIIEIVLTSKSPTAAAFRMKMRGFGTKKVSSCHSLAKLKRDYPDDFAEVIKNYQSHATNGKAERERDEMGKMRNFGATLVIVLAVMISGLVGCGVHGPDTDTNSTYPTIPVVPGPTNHAPIANADTYTTPINTPLDVPASGILTNDRDEDANPIAAVLVTTTTHGTLTLNSDGSFHYVPNSGYTGTDTFTYYATDGSLNSSTVTVTITITAANHAPVANSDSYTTSQNTTLNISTPGVLQNDSDPDGNPITAVLDTQPAHGTLSLNSNGSLTYVPNSGFSGTDSFTYHDSDGQLSSNVATVTITVNAVNHAPVANSDSYTTSQNTTLNISAPGVLGNDSDPDANPITAILDSQPSHGTLSLTSNGAFAYAPNSGFTGTDSFTYHDSDGQLSSNIATVTVTVTAVNHAPVANPDSYTTSQNTTLNISTPGVLQNDSDPDGNTITAVWVSGPSHGTLNMNPNGSFSYTPNSGYTGTDSFVYYATDGQLNSGNATVTITIGAVNHAPVANPDSYTTSQNTTLNISLPGVLQNDSDPDGNTITAVWVSGPSHGTLNMNPNGSFSYTPNSGYTGTDSFVYYATDGQLNSGNATVTITISAVNHAPVANPDSYTTSQNTTLNISALGVLQNDSDPDGNPITAVWVSGPSHGTLNMNPNGSFSYTPNSGYTGTDTFVYYATDGQLNSGNATVTITISAVNHAPVANPDSFATNQNTTLVVDSAHGVLINDVDQDGNQLTAILTAAASHGTILLQTDGSFTYIPVNGYAGTDTFSYKAFDGLLDSNVTTVTITINAVNHAPNAVDDNYTVNQDSTLNITAPGVMSNDNDADGDQLTSFLVTAPSHGSLIFGTNGSLTYIPIAGYSGTDTFTYRVWDGKAFSNNATVTITVVHLNQKPIANNDTYGINQDTTLNVGASGVMQNDSDPEGNPITASLVTAASHGTVILQTNGALTYIPVPGYSGPDSFTYRVFDGELYSDPATVNIQISHVNHAPIANNDQYFINEHTSVNSIWLDVAAPGVKANDSDPDNDSLTAVIDTYTTHGLMQLNPDGSFSYLPDLNWYGVDTFTYHVTDGYLNSNIATVTINVIRIDSDMDGVPDDQDCGPLNNTTWQIVNYYLDTDGDGIPNPPATATPFCVGSPTPPPAGYTLNSSPLDNCPDVSNPSQQDTDGDGVGDACATATIRVSFTVDPANYTLPAFVDWSAYGTGANLGLPDEFPQMGYGTTMNAEFRDPANQNALALGYFLMSVNVRPYFNPSVFPAANLNWLPFGIGATCSNGTCTGGTYYSGLPLMSYLHNGLTGIHFYYNAYGSNPAYDVELPWALLPNNQGGANYVVLFPGGTFPPGYQNDPIVVVIPVP